MPKNDRFRPKISEKILNFDQKKTHILYFKQEVHKSLQFFEIRHFRTQNYRFLGLFSIENSDQKLFLAYFSVIYSLKNFLTLSRGLFLLRFRQGSLGLSNRSVRLSIFLVRPGRIFLSVYFISVWWSVDSFWDAGYIGRGG